MGHSRPLKFRAWHRIDRCWHYFELIGVKGYPELEPSELRAYENRCIWTGLKDKNGVEIYFDDYYATSESAIYEVVWNVDRVSLKDIASGDIFDYISGGKIVGNKHEDSGKFAQSNKKI